MRLSELEATPPAGTAGPPGWVQLLLRPTGKGEVDKYADHPVNISGTPGGARVARALSGAGGALASAWPVDLLIGLVMVAIGK